MQKTMNSVVLVACLIGFLATIRWIAKAEEAKATQAAAEVHRAQVGHDLELGFGLTADEFEKDRSESCKVMNDHLQDLDFRVQQLLRSNAKTTTPNKELYNRLTRRYDSTKTLYEKTCTSS